MGILMLWDKMFYKYQLPYFSDYMTHWTIRCTKVLEEENRKKKKPASSPPPPPPAPRKPGKLHSDYTTHPPFPPKFGGKSASYSLKNTVSR